MGPASFFAHKRIMNLSVMHLSGLTVYPVLTVKLIKQGTTEADILELCQTGLNRTLQFS